MKLINRILLFISTIICITGLSCCIYNFDDTIIDGDNPTPNIRIQNNTSLDVVVIMVPANLPDNYLDSNTYYRATEIPKGEIATCRFYVSYGGYYFATGSEMEVFVVASKTYSSLSIQEIIHKPDVHLTSKTLDFDTFLLTEGIGRINGTGQNIELIWGY